MSFDMEPTVAGPNDRLSPDCQGQGQDALALSPTLSPSTDEEHARLEEETPATATVLAIPCEKLKEEHTDPTGTFSPDCQGQEHPTVLPNLKLSTDEEDRFLKEKRRQQQLLLQPHVKRPQKNMHLRQRGKLPKENLHKNLYLSKFPKENVTQICQKKVTQIWKKRNFWRRCRLWRRLPSSSSGRFLVPRTPFPATMKPLPMKPTDQPIPVGVMDFQAGGDLPGPAMDTQNKPRSDIEDMESLPMTAEDQKKLERFRKQRKKRNIKEKQRKARKRAAKGEGQTVKVEQHSGEEDDEIYENQDG